MKESIMLKLGYILLGAFILFTPMQARAENYCWDQKQEGAVTQVGWYKGMSASEEGSTKVEELPSDLSSIDSLIIRCAPNEECKNWLASISGDQSFTFTNFYNGEVQLGSADATEELFIDTLNAYSGNIKIYGDVRYIRAQANIEINGDVEYIALGEPQGDLHTDTVTINGNVKQIDWYNDAESTEFVCGFEGDVSVTGTVNNCDIYSPVYDSVIDRETWQKVGTTGVCSTGIFVMTDGVLSDEVNVTEVIPEMGDYKFIYSCYKSEYDDSTEFVKEAIVGNQHAFFEDCTLADIPEGAELIIYGTGGPIVIEKNLAVLSMQLSGGHTRTGNITVNGNVDKMYMDMYGVGTCNVNISGDVSNMDVNYRYNPNYNVTVGGKVEFAYIWGQMNGWFDCENLRVIVNGDFNPAMLIKTSLDEDAPLYTPITQGEKVDALANSNVGQEVTLSTANGDTVLVKDALVNIGKTNEGLLDWMQENEQMQNAMEELKNEITPSEDKQAVAKPVCGVDIDIQTYYKEKESGDYYFDDPNYGMEAVTELGDGKKLTFDVQIPSMHYDDTAQYVIVRSHYNADGSESINVLPTTQNGSMLTFESDKFSTFMVVKVSEEERDSNDGELGEAIPQPPQQNNQSQTTVTKPAPQPEAKPVTYVVQRGDNLSKIAKKNGISLQKLIAMNPQIKNPNLIYCGQVITISMDGVQDAKENAPINAKYYVVKKNDSLYRIARMHHLKLNQLYMMNKEIFAQKYIYAGQKVRVE